MLVNIMSIQETLQKDTEEGQRSLQREKEESIYKRDLRKRIELINWGFTRNEKARYFYL